MRNLALKDYQIAYSVDVEKDATFVLNEGFRPLDRDGMTPFSVSPPVEWAKDPFSDRNWMYQLHSWRMLDPFFNRMNESDRSFIGELMADWFTYYKNNPRATGWFWYDMSTGIRASKLAFLIMWCHQNSAPVPLKEWVLKDLIKTHFQHLTNLKELSSGNHGLFQLTGLMGLIDAVEVSGIYKAELDSSKAFAIENLSRLLREQLGRHGIHTEHSPSYHLFIATKINQVLAAPWWRITELDWARKLVDLAYIAKGWMLTPEMKCPPVGDSEEKIRQEKLNRMIQWPHEEVSGVLGASLDGYGVIKSKPGIPVDQSHYLFFQCSYNSGSHKHADCLSFLWQEGGQYIFHDSGKYSYQRDEVRGYFLSTRAHNCLEIDEADYSTRNQDAYGSALQEVKACDGGWFMHGHVFQRKLGVEHRRFIYYKPGVGVDVLDVVKNRQSEKRRYRLWWQLGPDTTIESIGNNVEARLLDGTRLVGRFQSNAGRFGLASHRGETKPRMAGWISRSYLEYEPSTAISASLYSGNENLYLTSSWRLDGNADFRPSFNVAGSALEIPSDNLKSLVKTFLVESLDNVGWRKRYARLAHSIGFQYPLLGRFLGLVRNISAKQKLKSLSESKVIPGIRTKIFKESISSDIFLEATRISAESRSLSFLADSRGSDSDLKGIFCASMSGRVVLVSKDVGASWRLFWSVSGKDSQRVDRLFVGSKAVFIRLRDPAELVVLTLEGKLLSRSNTGNYPWHGSQGISESPEGTIVYAEYQAGDETQMPMLNVWRTVPPYTKWSTVLNKSAARYPDGDIRHFHTCVADPHQPGVWYVSSGDSKAHNRLWMSVDDGQSWKELAVSCEDAQSYGIGDTERLLRFTSTHVSQEGMLWATDDGLGIGRSATVRCLPNYEEGVANLTILGFLGKNYARNLIKMESGYLVIGESKNEKNYVDFWILDQEGVPEEHLRKRNQLEMKSPVTNSLSSPVVIDGVAIIPDLGALSGQRGGILALDVS